MVENYEEPEFEVKEEWDKWMKKDQQVKPLERCFVFANTGIL